MEYKGFKIVNDGEFGYKNIIHKGSGRIPFVLSGSFTGFTEAEKAIDRYVNSKEKEKTNGSAKVSNRSK